MVTGLLLMVFGVVVALYPQILVATISTLLILTGLVFCMISWQWRRLRRRSEVPFVNWFIRF